MKFDLDNHMITKFSHACFITSDVESIVKEYCDNFGMGPWKIYDGVKGMIKGTNEALEIKAAVCDFENVSLMFIQPLQGEGIFSKYVKEKKSGFHHLICETVNSYEEALEIAGDEKSPVLETVEYENGLTITCTDHIRNLGTCLSFYKVPEGWKAPEPDRTYAGDGNSKYGFSVEKPLITRIMQLAFAVDNRWFTLHEYYDKYGIGPWSFHVQDKNSSEDLIYDGKEIEMSNLANVCNHTNVQLEILQPLDDCDNTYTYLRDRGPGLHHLCLEVSCSYDEVLELMKETGHPARRTCIMDGVEKCAHTDHFSTFGCNFEFVYRDKDFVPPIHQMYPAWAKPFKPTSLKKVF